MNRSSVSLLGFAGVLLFIITSVTAALLLPGYSSASQLISESYAIDTKYGLYLRMLGFLPSGICIAFFSLFVIQHLPKSVLTTIGFTGIGIFYGIATVVVSIFPCDAGCNKELIDPSVSQIIHNLSGLLTYLIVPVCILLLAIAAGKWKYAKGLRVAGFICSFLAFAFIVMLSSNPDSGFTGLYQRIVEGSILLWILFLSLYLRKI